ncbi:MAG: DUF362 domain-containing protein [Polyangiaceae bacterium]|nr:DUF362 domain-containing protein [Polyangiaceae bacterium]
MGDRPKRREVLQRIAASGGLLGMAAIATRLTYGSGEVRSGLPVAPRQVRDFRGPTVPGLATLAIAKSCRDPVELTRRAIEGLGGMARFVSRGDIVAVKPNIGWDRLPVHAANTNPTVVATVVRLAIEAGAKTVIVTDVSCNEPNRCFQRSGIWSAAHGAGGTVVLPAAHRFREIRMQGDVLDAWPIYTPLIGADKVINVPIAKHHNLARYTGAMKNWYGILGGRRNRLHQDIDVSIADLATFMRPTLTVLDATRVLLRNGPQGGNVDDTRDLYQVIASTDQVAVDAYGATLIGERPERIRYLALGRARGLGEDRWDRVSRVEV